MGYNQSWDQGHPNEFWPSSPVSYGIAPSHTVEAKFLGQTNLEIRRKRDQDGAFWTGTVSMSQ
ncbi:hypothetical protein BDR04DRAFT_1092383 [Suillus decipiens]|nr:hypothetical protein BDR04DRAFT_1092383 [Suillus decipiens]